MKIRTAGKVTVTAGAALGLALAPVISSAPPAQAASGATASTSATLTSVVHAADVQTITDTPSGVKGANGVDEKVRDDNGHPYPAGTYENADLISASASDVNGIITLTATPKTPVDPSTDPGWQTNTPSLTQSFVSWVLAPPGTEATPGQQYSVYFDTNFTATGTGPEAQIAKGAKSGLTPKSIYTSCAPTATYSPTTGYTVSFVAACVGTAATSFNYYSYIIYHPVGVSYVVGKTAPYALAFQSVSFGPTPVTATTAPGGGGGGSGGPGSGGPGSGSPGFSPLPAGYRLFASDGGVFSFGGAAFEGSAGSLKLNKPVVGGAATADGAGYWMVASDGGIFNYGDAHFYGSTGSLKLNKPVVAMAPSSDGGGYQLVASDGGVFSYGDATFQGSTGSLKLNKPIVGVATDPATDGYWLVASDGGIFAYSAPFFGSEGGAPLNKPIVGMASTPDGGGYWLVASDGGIFSFGDASFYGSTGSLTLNKPIVGMAATADGAGSGYRFVASDGGIFSYNAPFFGSEGGQVLNAPIVGMASQG